MLNPSVFIFVPLGKFIFDIFERRKDFPLFEFPIIPIINASSFLIFLKEEKIFLYLNFL